MKTKDLITFSHIYGIHKKPVYHYVLKMVRSSMTAEDVVQNVFMKLFEKMGTIKDFGSVRFWLLKTARNEVYTHFRKVKTHAEETLEGNAETLSGSSLSDEIEEKEMQEIVRCEIDLLPVELREIFVLREYSELSYEEIGEMLGLSKEIIKSRLFSIRQKLIKNIAKKLE